MKDPADKGKLSIMYFPTHLMLADYYTKPLQGALFHKSRYIIVGRVSPYKILKHISPYSSKELVENQIPGKQIPRNKIPPKKQIPSGDPRITEDKKGKKYCTYADIVSAGTATYGLSNRDN